MVRPARAIRRWTPTLGLLFGYCKTGPEDITPPVTSQGGSGEEP
jgi:hypothetical protein